MSVLEEMRQRANVVMDHPVHVTICMSQADVPALLKAVDAVLALAVRLEASPQCEDREIAEDLRAAVNDALEGGK